MGEDKASKGYAYVKIDVSSRMDDLTGLSSTSIGMRGPDLLRGERSKCAQAQPQIDVKVEYRLHLEESRVLESFVSLEMVTRV